MEETVKPKGAETGENTVIPRFTRFQSDASSVSSLPHGLETLLPVHFSNGPQHPRARGTLVG